MFKIKRIEKRVNTRKLMYSMLAFVLIGITTMTIAYATLSTTLKITGSAEFQDASWNLLLEELNEIPWTPGEGTTIDGNVIISGKSKVLQKPTIQGTSLNNFKISFGQIGDFVSLEYKLTNLGDIPARLESVIYSEPTITSSTNDQDDITMVKDFFENVTSLYFLKIEDGKLTDDGKFMIGDILCPGATIEVYVSHSYSIYAPRIPYSKIEISNIGVDFNFLAADQNLCDGDTPYERVDNEDIG